MSGRFVAAALFIAGVIHLLPLAGVLGMERLAAMYGIASGGPDIEILMRHRAVLFGLLGAFLIGAALIPPWRTPAVAAGAASMASFIFLAWSIGGFNAAIRRIVMIDAAVLALLALATVLALVRRS